jgi:hypothetical protein
VLLMRGFAESWQVLANAVRELRVAVKMTAVISATRATIVGILITRRLMAASMLINRFLGATYRRLSGARQPRSGRAFLSGPAPAAPWPLDREVGSHRCFFSGQRKRALGDVSGSRAPPQPHNRCQQRKLYAISDEHPNDSPQAADRAENGDDVAYPNHA